MKKAGLNLSCWLALCWKRLDVMSMGLFLHSKQPKQLAEQDGQSVFLLNKNG